MMQQTHQLHFMMLLEAEWLNQSDREVEGTLKTAAWKSSLPEWTFTRASYNLLLQ